MTVSSGSVLDLNGLSVTVGSFSGAAGLTKTGNGVPTLTSSSNSYTGPTTVNNGELVVNGSLYDSNASASTTTHSGVTVQTANPNLAAGRIILNGEQQFGGQGNYAAGQVTTANTYTGNTTLSGGTLQVGNGASRAITFGGGALQFAGGNTLLDAETYSGALSGRGSLVTGVTGGSTTFSGVIANGSGTFSGTITNNSGLVFNNAATQYVPAQKLADRDDQQRELAEYQQKLVKDNGTLVFAGPSLDQTGGGQAAAAVVNAAVMDFGPRTPAGLASLDFELPTDKTRYDLFRFTTPRGEAELTARSISNSLLGRLELLIGLVVASLLVFGALRVVQSGVLGWFRRPLRRDSPLPYRAGIALQRHLSLCRDDRPAGRHRALGCGAGANVECRGVEEA